MTERVCCMGTRGCPYIGEAGHECQREPRVLLRTNSQGVLVGVRLDPGRTCWLTAHEAATLAADLLAAAQGATRMRHEGISQAENERTQ